MATDLYGLEASGLPPEMVARLQGLTRQQAIAEAMLRQSMQAPEAGAVKGRFQGVTSPLEHVGKLVQAVLAGQDVKGAQQGREALAGEASAGRKAAIEAMMAKYRGTPEVAYNDTVGDQPPQATIQPGVAADPRGAIMDARANPFLANTKFVDSMESNLNRTEAREDTQKFQKWQAEQRAMEKLNQIREAAAQGRITKAEADARHAELVKELAQIKKGGAGASPYFQAVGTPEGVMAFDARTGTLKPATVGGAPVMKTTDDPQAQANIAKAKETGAGTGKANEEQFQAATAATDNIHKIDTLLTHLKSSDAITGLGAETMKNIERAKALVTGSIAAGKKVSDTEILDVMMGSEVFPLIKALGVGARGMDTPAEREFMRSVLTGSIPLNKDTLIRMAEIRRDIAKRAIDRWNERVDKGEVDDYFKYSGRTKGKVEITPVNASGLTPAEQEELAALKKRFGK